ncbi:NADH-ubiquinone oxidoreductase chain C [hydrothermal vent metagenome]|uniref:NADH-ubiquinone oxidoreductase chain C n=1 Tax=hydrothermal vent metagenome TaxID=652676 RepID=A0A1W1EE09_9ZZZZ
MNEVIKSRFGTEDIEIKREDLSKVVVDRTRVFELINMLVMQYDYVTLNAITCTDWLEDEHFAISYILTTRDRKHTFMVQTQISRENATIDSLVKSFAQAEIMERDLHEMYGIDFPGNSNLIELSLENWVHTPPLRREFDTLEFVNEFLTFRDGRDDNVDTKAEQKRLRALKKAAKAKAAEEEAKKAALEEAKNPTTVEAPKEEAKKVEVEKVEAEKVETKKVETKKAEAPKNETKVPTEEPKAKKEEPKVQKEAPKASEKAEKVEPKVKKVKEKVKKTEVKTKTEEVKDGK